MDDDRENRTQAIEQDRQKQPVTGSSEKPGSSGGKLWIKLKIPKDGDGDGDEDHQIGPQRNDQPRVCNVCNKRFSSGKALGGHMRVHVQAEKLEREEFLLKKLKTNHQQQTIKYKSSKLRPELPENREGPNAAAADDKPTCSLCGKNFPSMKSLFGHMRCHPEREWRGIQPPATATTKNSSALLVVSDDAEPQRVDHRIDSDFATMGSRVAAIDLTQSLPGWSVTARRGRKALTTAATPPTRRVLSAAEEEQLHEAVQDLMTLARGDSLESGLTHKHGAEVPEGTNSNSMTNKAEIEDRNWVLESNKRRIEESPVGNKRDFRAKKPRIDGNLDKGKGKFELETDDKSLTDEELNCKNSDGSTVPSEEQLIKNYKCESNNSNWPVTMMMIKSKKTKRKKLKMRDLESVRDGISSIPLLPVEDQIHMRTKTITDLVPRDRDRYKCSTCNKCFPTHQALGGHRSSHNKVRLINTTTSHTINDDSSSSPADEIYPQSHPAALKSKLRNNQTFEESSSPAYDDETKEKELGGAASADDSNNTHQCNICNKRFSTGQALGGHKRCHWTGAPAADSPGEAGRKILDFDLNQLPAMEEEVGDGGDGGVESEVHTGGSGNAASSSHNSIA